MTQSTHESFSRDEAVIVGSDRSFGIVMACAFAVVTLLNGWHDGRLWPWTGALAHIEFTIANSLRQQNGLRSGVVEALPYCTMVELRCDIAMLSMVFDLRKPVGSDREIEITVGRLFPRFDTLARKMCDETLAAVAA